ncbi:FAD/NAD(P)-binding domain-containing protein [Mycena sanguinolenta]|uniref:FAD/NAD(P)-binding domain-containing protein n=1 Tax=Mycena sanguinolenta TaxID=230812 RepID=A0A8H6ZBH5_9AGAR|nr:FAD/NAD(P)-binding domain-containing protein [Mycena sanguinolenta]
MDSAQPLNVAIVDAGIGGLTAAIALRRSGHRVQVFEASQTKTEIGAGIGVQGNAQRILRQFGFSRDNLKPVEWEGTVVFDAKNGVGIPRPWQFSRPNEPNNAFCHRGDLHDELKRLALGEGEGRPVELHLNSKVVACDPEAGTITFSNGEIVHADVVIGADGIHSVIRTSIIGYAIDAPPSGWTAFRCLLDPSNLNDLTDLEWLTEGTPRGQEHYIETRSIADIFHLSLPQSHSDQLRRHVRGSRPRTRRLDSDYNPRGGTCKVPGLPPEVPAYFGLVASYAHSQMADAVSARLADLDPRAPPLSSVMPLMQRFLRSVKVQRWQSRMLQC